MDNLQELFFMSNDLVYVRYSAMDEEPVPLKYSVNYLNDFIPW